jgi:hypothetical protein
MKKIVKTKLSLSLSQETVRTLSAETLKQIAAGGGRPCTNQGSGCTGQNV